MTIVGKFIKGKPNMDELRKLFFSQYQLKGTVKIAYYDYQTVYLDFTNETDMNHIYFKPFINIGPYTMKILKWAPDFKPEQETSIVPVWILFHKLPWHLFRWDVISRMVSSIGKSVAPDLATYSKSRGNVAKIKVEIDLFKLRLDSIWLGFKRPDGTNDGRWLEVEYERPHAYCQYCKMQGYEEKNCRNKVVDEGKKV